MQLGFVGLGRMGFNMVTRLAQGGHQVVATDLNPEAVKEIAAKPGVSGAATVRALVEQLAAPRAVWVMVPSGGATEAVIKELAELLEPGDIVIDGGNSNFRESMRHGQELAKHGLEFVDQGTSGGIWGLTVGFCLMIGASAETFAHLEPAFATLAPPDGYLHCGPIGSGHYVKMVHNGIEYGMMQAYGEGFELLRESGFGVDLGKVAHLWNQGSVVRSWLCELIADAFKDDPDLAGIRGYVEDSGEARWTVIESLNQNVPTPIITLSLMERFRSRQDESFSAKVVAALRREFGGHRVKTV